MKKRDFCRKEEGRPSSLASGEGWVESPLTLDAFTLCVAATGDPWFTCLPVSERLRRCGLSQLKVNLVAPEAINEVAAVPEVLRRSVRLAVREVDRPPRTGQARDHEEEERLNVETHRGQW